MPRGGHDQHKADRAKRSERPSAPKSATVTIGPHRAEDASGNAVRVVTDKRDHALAGHAGESHPAELPERTAERLLVVDEHRPRELQRRQFLGEQREVRRRVE
jgi:hypothetical protein